MRWEAFAAALLLVPSIAAAQQNLDPTMLAPAARLLSAQIDFADAKTRVQQGEADGLRKQLRQLCDSIAEDKRVTLPECGAKTAEAKP